jgi:uncharacterized membrane protein required for colicin V production
MSRCVGWILVVVMAVAVYFGFRMVPSPGSLLIAGAAVGVFIGYLAYEHVAEREHIPNRTVAEQLLLGILVLVILGALV